MKTSTGSTSTEWSGPISPGDAYGKCESYDYEDKETVPEQLLDDVNNFRKRGGGFAPRKPDSDGDPQDFNSNTRWEFSR